MEDYFHIFSAVFGETKCFVLFVKKKPCSISFTTDRKKKKKRNMHSLVEELTYSSVYESATIRSRPTKHSLPVRAVVQWNLLVGGTVRCHCVL